MNTPAETPVESLYENGVYKGHLTQEQKEHLKLFIAALRSGDYKQGRHQLVVRESAGNKYCCLGVACDVFRKTTGKGEWKDDYFVVDGKSSFEDLIKPVQDWLGFPRQNPKMFDGKEFWSATMLNDNHMATFTEIANMLENTYLKE